MLFGGVYCGFCCCCCFGVVVVVVVVVVLLLLLLFWGVVVIFVVVVFCLFVCLFESRKRLERANLDICLFLVRFHLTLSSVVCVSNAAWKMQDSCKHWTRWRSETLQYLLLLERFVSVSSEQSLGLV